MSALLFRELLSLVLNWTGEDRLSVWTKGTHTLNCHSCWSTICMQALQGPSKNMKQVGADKLITKLFLINACSYINTDIYNRHWLNPWQKKTRTPHTKQTRNNEDHSKLNAWSESDFNSAFIKLQVTCNDHTQWGHPHKQHKTVKRTILWILICPILERMKEKKKQQYSVSR